MRFKFVLFVGLLAVSATSFAQLGHAEEPPLRIQGDATFEFRLLAEPDPCSAEDDVGFRAKTKSVEFEYAWVDDEAERHFFALMTEVWRTDGSWGCHTYSDVDRMDVSVFNASSSGQSAPLYTLSIAPESHDQFADVAVVKTSGAFLKLYAGERAFNSDPSGAYRYYDIRTGKFLFSADQWGLTGAREIRGEGAGRSIVTMTVPNAKGADYIARIGYFSAKGSNQRAEIRLTPLGSIDRDRLSPRIIFLRDKVIDHSAQDDSISGDSAVMAIATLEASESGKSKFEVSFALSYDIDVVVPIAGDRLDFSRVRMPAGFVIVSIE
jgi:hypothetical protein